MNLEGLIRQFEDAEDATFQAREFAERDRDFYDGIQITKEEAAETKKRGQPLLKFNRIRGKVDWYKGLEAQRRTDPKAYPRTPQHEQGAEAATDSIRFVCDKEDWDSVRSKIYEDMLIEGFGGVEVVHKETPKGVEVVVNYYAWDRLGYDPHSSAPDFKDAQYLFSVVWSDADELKAKHPKATAAIQWTIDDSSRSDTYDDKPKYHMWGDKNRNRVRVVMMWYRENGAWKWALFHKGGVLDEGDSPYMNEDGESVCPLLLQSMYVDRDNNRYGVVRDLIDPQTEINKRRSKLLHDSISMQTIGEDGAVKSLAKLDREKSRPNGHIEVTPGMRFDVIPRGEMTMAQMNLLQHATGEMERAGANDALSGEGPEESGRALIARQSGGMVQIASQVDMLHQLNKRVYEHIWMRIRQFWTEERWIRVTDDERNVRFVGINRAVTLGEHLQELPEEELAMVAQQMQLRPNDPRFEMPVKVENAVEEMEVDIVLEEVPDQMSMQSEQFQSIMGLAPAIMQAEPSMAGVVLELMVDTAPGLKSDQRDKFRKTMEENREQQAQGGGVQQQMQEQAMQMEMASKDAEIRATNAKAEKDEASAIKTVVEAQFAAGMA